MPRVFLLSQLRKHRAAEIPVSLSPAAGRVDEGRRSPFMARAGRAAYLCALLLIAIGTAAPECLADTIRLTTWNLQALAAGTNAATAPGQLSLSSAAAALRKLAPDVILLQQVRDWRTCEELARALKPADYRVLVCSAFPDGKDGQGSAQQVALLARQRAYLSWAQPWNPGPAGAAPGGVAFAALEVRGQRLGLFSVAGNDGAQPVRQLLSEVASVRGWVTNRVEVFVVAGTLGSDLANGLGTAGFSDAFVGAATVGKQPGPTDHILVLPPGCASNAFISASAGAGHFPVTCDLELDSLKVAAEWAALKEALSRAGSPPAAEAGHPPQITAPAAAPSRPPPRPFAVLAACALAGALGVGAAAWWLARRVRRRPSKRRGLLVAPPTGAGEDPPSFTVVLGTQSVTSPAPSAPGSVIAPPPLIRIEGPGPTETHAEMLRRRAQAAESAAVRHGLMADLSRWLKQKLVRKLISDRADLLHGQHAAAAKARSVEERLARVERQIQQQTQGYLQRIDQLTHDLVAAKAENRELIRAQIRQVKAEMEAARARLLARADEADGG